MKQGRVWTGAEAPPLPKRAPNVKCKTVPCPSCGAEVGEPCKSASGKPIRHPVRQRMAARKLNAERAAL